MNIEWLVLATHALATTMMAGLIWFVQVVHYPMFALLDGAGFREYARIHAERTTWIVAPLMSLEAITAIYLIWNPPAEAGALPLIGVALLLLAWTSTAVVQMPCHARLAGRFDHRVIRRLVITNWIRTAAWSSRGVLALALLAPPTTSALA